MFLWNYIKSFFKRNESVLQLSVLPKIEEVGDPYRTVSFEMATKPSSVIETTIWKEFKKPFDVRIERIKSSDDGLPSGCYYHFYIFYLNNDVIFVHREVGNDIASRNREPTIIANVISRLKIAAMENRLLKSERKFINGDSFIKTEEDLSKFFEKLDLLKESNNEN